MSRLWKMRSEQYPDTMPRFVHALLAVLFLAAIMANAQPAPKYQYFRTGSPKDISTKPQAGFALMGGGSDIDEAFLWLCDRAKGGDFLILRATGTNAYNPYVHHLCKLNSVATLVLPSREAANDPFVATTLRNAEAIFIAGGDQANYIRNWTGTPVQTELNKAIERGVPLGGTSAGLAVMGEWAYTAEGDKPDDPNLDSKTALNDPLGPRITLKRGFLDIPILKGVITDSHFAKRDRMGRLFVFLACISTRHPETLEPGKPVTGLGIDQEAAVLLEPDGNAAIAGHGNAYWIFMQQRLVKLEQAKPLTDGSYLIWKFSPGERFQIWKPENSWERYGLDVIAGKIYSSEPENAIY